jgi:hypothetical protein
MTNAEVPIADHRSRTADPRTTESTTIEEDEDFAIFFAMAHNPRRCDWCAAIGDRIHEHMSRNTR